MKKIILASTSPRRKELLKNLNIPFTVEASEYQEDMTIEMKPINLVKHLAFNKAKFVANKHESGIIIGADTFVVLNNKLLGKPRNSSMARDMLKVISGKKVNVLSGYAIIDAKTKKKYVGYSSATVYIKKLSPKEISWYIKTKEPLDKAGGFAVQGFGAVFIKKIEGDFFSVVGLPIYSLVKELKKFNVNVI